MNHERRRAGRKRRAGTPPYVLPDDLYAYLQEPQQRAGQARAKPPHVFDIERLPVIDDWPEKVPVTDAEILVFERWFADVFDEMFGSADWKP
jgi:hypothetical protein